jgi:hypothetical protein
MRRGVAVTFLLALGPLVSACSGACQAPEGRLPVDIGQADLLQLESFPVQLVLHVDGWLPNPCASAKWEISDVSPSELHVALFAVPDGSEACIQVLAPFSVDIPLGAQPPDVRILVNGQPVGDG